MFLNFKMNEGDVCLADCATTNTILREKIYFFNLITTNTSVSTISGTSNLIEGSERANIVLPNGTRFHINDALYFRKSRRNLLSFKDIRRNGYHIETMNEGNKMFIYYLYNFWKKNCRRKALSILLWVISYDHKVY